MFTVIVAINDEQIYQNNLLKSLSIIKEYLSNHNLPELQILEFRDTRTSIIEKYNDGIKHSKYKTKFFIRENVSINDDIKYPIFFRCLDYFNLYENVHLIGTIGTKELVDDGKRWWECHKDNIYGHVLNSGAIGDYWKWNIDEYFIKDIMYADGMFLASQNSLLFPEEIKGSSFCDVSYCDIIRSKGYEIGLISHCMNQFISTTPIIENDFLELKTEYFKFRSSLKNT